MTVDTHSASPGSLYRPGPVVRVPGAPIAPDHTLWREFMAPRRPKRARRGAPGPSIGSDHMPIALSSRVVLAIMLCLTMTVARRVAAQASDSLATATPAAAARTRADAEARPARFALTFKPISTL